jgi:hypothetical protein
LRFVDEFRNHVIRIRRVPNRIRAAKKHLEADIGNALAQLPQPLPRIFVQETQRSIKGGAAPYFQAEKLRQPVRDGVGRRQ